MNAEQMKSLEDNLANLAAATAKATLAKELADLSAFSKSAVTRIARLAEYIRKDDVACADKAKAAVASAEATVIATEIALASAIHKVDDVTFAVVKDLTVLSASIEEIKRQNKKA